MKSSGQLHVPTAWPLGKQLPVTTEHVGSLGPKTSLDALERIALLPLAEIESRYLSRPARSLVPIVPKPVVSLSLCVRARVCVTLRLNMHFSQNPVK
jgi:hypothetical protein